MKRKHSETSSGSWIAPKTPVPNDNKGDDQYLYVVLEHNAVAKCTYTFHRFSVSRCLTSGSRRDRYGGEKRPKILPKPIHTFGSSFPAYMAFFSVGSKIYMVGGVRFAKHCEPDILCRECYVFDTCNNPSNRLENAPPLNHGKNYPHVLGPIKGKFYVHGSSLASGDIEEFDPEKEFWTLILFPKQYIEDGHDVNDYEVRSHAIVDNKIILSTCKDLYALDVVSSKWEVLGKLCAPVPPCVVSLDNLWYGGRNVQAYSFDWDNGFQGCQTHGVWKQSSRLLKCQTSIKLVPAGERTLVAVQFGYPDPSCRPCYITVNMYEFTEFRLKSNGKPKHPRVSKGYSKTYVNNTNPHKLVGASTCLVMMH